VLEGSLKLAGKNYISSEKEIEIQREVERK
jgi:hypothetical protein